MPPGIMAEDKMILKKQENEANHKNIKNINKNNPNNELPLPFLEES